MLIARSIDAIPSLDPPCGLTIGNFDGMHPGHLYIFQTLRSKIGASGKLVVLTFNNHPSDVFPTRPKTPLLCSPNYKLELIKRAGADLVIALDFTKEYAETPYNIFLNTLRQHLPFSQLILGKGASFGKNREGNETNVSKLARELDFQVCYLEKQTANGEMISSGLIRTSLETGDLAKVKTLLGRSYALYGKFINGTLDTSGLCLPPPGTYSIMIYLNNRHLQGQCIIKAETSSHVQISCEENLLECTIEAVFI